MRTQRGPARPASTWLAERLAEDHSLPSIPHALLVERHGERATDVSIQRDERRAVGPRPLFYLLHEASRYTPTPARLIHIQQVDPHANLAQLAEHLPCSVVNRALQASLDVADDAAIHLSTNHRLSCERGLCSDASIHSVSPSVAGTWKASGSSCA